MGPGTIGTLQIWSPSMQLVCLAFAAAVCALLALDALLGRG